MSDTPAENPPTSRRAAREAARAASAGDRAPEHAVDDDRREHDAVAAAPRSAAGAAAPAPSIVPADAAQSAGAGRRGEGSLDALFDEEASREERARGARDRRDDRKSAIARWVALGVVLVIVGGIVAAGAWVWNTYEEPIRDLLGWSEPKDYEDGIATGEALVTVAEGDTGCSISPVLFEAGVTKTEDVFCDYLISSALNADLQPGVYLLQQQMTSAAALAALEDPENRQELGAQLREGLTVDQSLAVLSEGTGIELAAFEEAAADPSAYGVEAGSLEGWLFPATYAFDPGTTAEQIIQRLVTRTVESLDAAEVPVDQREEILTIASIIEKEARYEEDFYKVSRVIQNRMDPDISETNGLLQMDSTAQYFFDERDGGTSSNAQELGDENEWNTYVHPGLPAGPIANPGDTAIDAAMHPADGPWQYFVTVNLDTGETVFTTTYAEHEQEVLRYQQWCQENPDGGC